MLIIQFLSKKLEYKKFDDIKLFTSFFEYLLENKTNEEDLYILEMIIRSFYHFGSNLELVVITKSKWSKLLFRLLLLLSLRIRDPRDAKDQKNIIIMQCYIIRILRQIYSFERNRNIFTQMIPQNIFQIFHSIPLRWELGTEQSFEESTNALSLDETEYELLLRRIDLLRKRYLYKSDLYEFFIPFNEDCRQKIKNEKNKDINMNTNLKNSFSKGTMIYINNLINIVIKGEKEINMKKKKLNNEGDFIEKIFNDICNISKNDNNENKYNDYFNKEQLFKYLTEILNLEISEDDMNLFFIRLDKLRRGKIQILEFSDEMKCINLKYF